LFGLDPEASPLEELVAQLRGEIEPERLVPAAIVHILAASASWPGEHALFDSFDEGDEIAVLLAGKRQSKSRTLAAILAGPIDQRRHLWAELLAWLPFSARASTVGGAPWRELCIVARELLSGRPIVNRRGTLTPRIASSKLLPNKLTVVGMAARANLVAGAHDGVDDQHGGAARARGRGSGALSDGGAGREGADSQRAYGRDWVAPQACGAGASPGPGSAAAAATTSSAL
jgi:hypothetical protein